MTQRPSSLHDRLRAIDAGHAERQTRLIAALNARRAGALTLAARAAFERDRHAAGAWIGFRAGGRPVLVAPLLVDGELARLSAAPGGTDPAVAAALLGRIESLVVAIESALGEDLYPDGLQAAAPDDAILLRIDAHEGGGLRHRLIVALPAGGELPEPLLPEAPPALIAALRAPWRAILDGPALAVSRIGAIGVGDLLLLGIRPLVVRTVFNGRGAGYSGRIDLSQGTLTLQDDIAQPSPSGALSPTGTAPAAGDGIDLDALKVATTIEIDGGQLSAREIAALGAGSVLSLPGGGGTLSVRVLAGGTPIGAGELVAVGEAFGVLFTAVATAPDASGQG